MFDRLRNDPRVWHFAFHYARDLPELLVQGRERQYLQYFFDARTTDPSATDVDVYAKAYSAPGAMRAGFELYRAFDQDAATTAPRSPPTVRWGSRSWRSAARSRPPAR